MRRMFVWSMIGIATALTACGGGGGGGGPSPDAFQGVYGWVEYLGHAGPPMAGTGAWGEVTSDGLGTISDSISWDITNGVLGGPYPSVSTVPYTLDSAGRMAWLIGAMPSFQGGVSADGRQAILASAMAGMDPLIVLMLRRASGMDNASLSGLYHYAQVFTTDTGTVDGGVWGAADFDGAGNVGLTVWVNTAGAVSGPWVYSETYVVGADGTLLFSLTTDGFVGGVRQDGEVAFFGGGVNAGDVSTTGVLVKYASGATNSTFSGPYHFVAMGVHHQPSPTINWTSITGLLDSDGAGTYTWQEGVLVQDDGTADDLMPPFLPTPYAVAGNGGITLFGPGVGAVAEDGSVAAFYGGTENLSSPSLWVMVR